ncbi:hypothetical protein SAMN04487963_2365 [Marinobacter zhejiangensis]|uniref:Uncharacterized protein n=1 Tax=Marinobacter zhejiangensis TaxID=488535 RepID=A0A1I4QFP5_9GAMM|nr:hypothetical protein SAMN04487963_2365 [Marinobacter zhejiangensis]
MISWLLTVLSIAGFAFYSDLGSGDFLYGVFCPFGFVVSVAIALAKLFGSIGGTGGSGGTGGGNSSDGFWGGGTGGWGGGGDCGGGGFGGGGDGGSC